MLFQCWASLVDNEQTLKQHWFNALCLHWVMMCPVVKFPRYFNRGHHVSHCVKPLTDQVYTNYSAKLPYCT